MIRFAADEDFHGAITRGLLRRGIDVERAQDAQLAGASDERILDWAANAGRVLLTHDRTTLLAVAYSRIQSGAVMAGVIASSQSLTIGAAISDLELIATCSHPAEWVERIAYLPLR
jgi:Domain of unknown function (DUF5615)